MNLWQKKGTILLVDGCRRAEVDRGGVERPETEHRHTTRERKKANLHTSNKSDIGVLAAREYSLKILFPEDGETALECAQ
uniref:Uncharacterized protein n=1 Tax=Setaria digitata TaxID=48799 RepID=A0A915PTA8_9BILA